MSDSQQQTIERYRELLQTMASASALRSAHSLGMLDRLRDGQRDLPTLSELCGIPPAKLEPLMAVLLAIGVVEPYGEYWALSQAARLLVGPDSDAGDSLFAELDHYLRDPSYSASLNRIRERLTARQWTRTPAAMRLAQVLEIGGKRKGLRVLELGGGASVWSAAMSFRDSTMQVTTIDVPEHLKIARQTMESIGVADRWTAVEADYRTYPLPLGEFDLVIVAEAVQLEDDPSAVTLLGRSADALCEGGEIALIESFWDVETVTLPMAVAALEIAIGAPQGRLRSVPELERFLRGAGFVDAQWTWLGTEHHDIGLIVAKKQAGLWQNLGFR